jgi:hypothetical protein
MPSLRARRFVTIATKAKRKPIGWVISKFCGYFYCEECITKKRTDPENGALCERICDICNNNYIKKLVFYDFWKKVEIREEIIGLKSAALNIINERVTAKEVEVSNSNIIIEKRLSEMNAALSQMAEEEKALRAAISEKNQVLDRLAGQENQQETSITLLMIELKAAQNQVFELQEEITEKNKQNMDNVKIEADLKDEISGLINSIYQRKQIVKENTAEFERESSTRKSKKSNQLMFKSVAPGPKKRYYDPNMRKGLDCKCVVM